MDEVYKKTFEIRLTGATWEMPQDIGEWLGRLLLLYGVPFNYLVPDEAMLPPESIRFFYLDPGWMKCLLEGACSVGKSSSLDELFDQNLRNRFLDLAGQKASEVRAGASGGVRFRITEQSLDNLRNDNLPSDILDKLKAIKGKEYNTGNEFLEAVKKEVGNDQTVKFKESILQRARGPLNWPLTGFLLRSDLVEGWQGLEMKASGVDGQGNHIDPLPALRIDRLSPDIMLCLFNGKVTGIEIKQPPEGLHFGAAFDSGSNAYKKYHLRKLTPAENMGDQLSHEFGINVPMRSGRRVIDIQALAKTMEQALQGVKALNGPFTSAEFAVQMVDPPGKAIFGPVITGIAPSSGPAAGGQHRVVIQGVNLRGAKSVTFGATAATITESTDSSIIVTTPAGPPVAVSVVAEVEAGTAILKGGYTYEPGDGGPS